MYNRARFSILQKSARGGGGGSCGRRPETRSSLRVASSLEISAGRRDWTSASVAPGTSFGIPQDAEQFSRHSLNVEASKQYR
jgi:hypothetical protein